MDGLIDAGAEFSDDRVYRWRLWRRWDHGPMLMVVGLNPSTADEHTDDPTVRRCIGYAKRWGYAGLRMLNVFPYRATDPRELVGHMKTLYRDRRDDYLSVTTENYRTIMSQARITLGTENGQQQPGAVLCAWGNGGQLFDAARQLAWS